MSEAKERQRLRRKHDAERATMPLLISEVHRYAMDAKQKVQPLFGHLEGNTLNKAGIVFEPPKLPEALPAQLKNVIEATNSKHVQERLADIITTIQLINARLEGIQRAIANESTLILRANLQEDILDIVSLYGLSGSMFKYSRRQTDILETYDYESMRSLLRQLYFFDDTNEDDGIDGVNFRTMMETLKRRQEDGLSPYIFDEANYRKITGFKKLIRSVVVWLDNWIATPASARKN